MVSRDAMRTPSSRMIWTHQPPLLEEQTLSALAGGPFNKLRMCLFPKHFLYNSNEPERFVFPRSDEIAGTRRDSTWITSRTSKKEWKISLGSASKRI